VKVIDICVIKLQSCQAGFKPRSGHVGFVGDRVVVGQVFSEYFGFRCQFSFHRLPHSSSSSSSSNIRDWYSRPNSGRRTKWTQSHTNPRNLKIRNPYIHVIILIFQDLTFKFVCTISRNFRARFSITERP
jgi:hypothetical protein